MKLISSSFILNIVLSNSVLLATSPITLTTLYIPSWIWGDTTCQVTVYVQIVSIVVMLWSLTFRNIYNYRLNFIHRHRSIFTPFFAVFTTVCLWIVMFMIFIPLTLWFKTCVIYTRKSCVLVLSSIPPFYVYFFMSMMTLVWILPALICSYIFYKTYPKLLRMDTLEHLVRSSLVAFANGTDMDHGYRGWTRPEPQHSAISRSAKRHQKVRDLLLTSSLVILLLVASTPFMGYLVLATLGTMNDGYPRVVVHTIFLGALTAIILMTFLNWIWTQCGSGNSKKFLLQLFCGNETRIVAPVIMAARYMTTTV